MADEQRRAALAQRLAQAGAAHGEYEMTALHGEYDQQWADWYAHYLLGHGWNETFNNPWETAELAGALTQANTDHLANDPKTPWHEFYAARFAARS
jgi:hypothetical protein